MPPLFVFLFSVGLSAVCLPLFNLFKVLLDVQLLHLFLKLNSVFDSELSVNSGFSTRLRLLFLQLKIGLSLVLRHLIRYRLLPCLLLCLLLLPNRLRNDTDRRIVQHCGVEPGLGVVKLGGPTR